VAQWGFLTNHGLVLTYVGRHPDSLGVDIAQALGITERAVRKIVADLRAEGYLEPEKVGRRNRYRIHTHKTLPHVGQQVVTVGDLLAVLWQGAIPGQERTSDGATFPTPALLEPGRR
jgi:hypothetical protein